ncbi:hypothetical protein [Roseiconus lacunae]|uniref:hypothetical protein n=1 Tax=Roseiconus lacunae TaxID=2605694 RepID=UPI001E53656A|nr:hypothetical protein [Roseiconus lacunae]MCD0458838.1 hypothetical protein [Roseiconus lacunae]
MARRKPARKPTPDHETTRGLAGTRDETGDATVDAASTSPDATTVERSPVVTVAPTGWVPILISLAVILHLAALFVSYSAIVEPSSTQGRLLETLTPYLRGTHFAADGRRFYLAHATPDEQPHRLQVASADANGQFVIDRETRWTTIEPSGPSGLAASDRYAKWMTLAATLSESDQRSLAAQLLLPLVKADESIAAVRIVRLPTQLTTAEQDAMGPAYLARVVRNKNGVKLVAIESRRLTTMPRDTNEVTP